MDSLVLSRLLFGAVVWAPLAPLAPVLLETTTPANDTSTRWRRVEVLARSWYRWALGVPRATHMSVAALYVLADRPSMALLVQKAVWRYVWGLQVPLGTVNGRKYYRAARSQWDAMLQEGALTRHTGTRAYFYALQESYPISGPSALYQAART